MVEWLREHQNSPVHTIREAQEQQVLSSEETKAGIAPDRTTEENTSNGRQGLVDMALGTRVLWCRDFQRSL